jgi:hypothetical protein
MDAIKRCHVQVHEMGAPRINSTVKLEAPKGVTRRAHLLRLLPWTACTPVLQEQKPVQTSPRTTSLGLRLAPCISALASCVALPPASLQSCTLLVAQRAFAVIQRCPNVEAQLAGD